MMRHLFLFYRVALMAGALVIFTATASSAATLADLAGTWKGDLMPPGGAAIPVVVHVMADGTGSMDSPSQGAMGIPASDFHLEQTLFTFNVPNISGSYSGKLAADMSSIDGQWSQNGFMLPLVLKPDSGKPSAAKN